MGALLRLVGVQFFTVSPAAVLGVSLGAGVTVAVVCILAVFWLGAGGPVVVVGVAVDALAGSLAELAAVLMLFLLFALAVDNGKVLFATGADSVLVLETVVGAGKHVLAASVRSHTEVDCALDAPAPLVSLFAVGVDVARHLDADAFLVQVAFLTLLAGVLSCVLAPVHHQAAFDLIPVLAPVANCVVAFSALIAASFAVIKTVVGHLVAVLITCFDPVLPVFAIEADLGGGHFHGFAVLRIGQLVAGLPIVLETWVALFAIIARLLGEGITFLAVFDGHHAVAADVLLQTFSTLNLILETLLAIVSGRVASLALEADICVLVGAVRDGGRRAAVAIGLDFVVFEDFGHVRAGGRLLHLLTDDRGVGGALPAAVAVCFAMAIFDGLSVVWRVIVFATG